MIRWLIIKLWKLVVWGEVPKGTEYAVPLKGVKVEDSLKSGRVRFKIFVNANRRTGELKPKFLLHKFLFTKKGDGEDVYMAGCHVEDFADVRNLLEQAETWAFENGYVREVRKDRKPAA